MKDLRPNILDDYEHRVLRLLDHHGGEAGFPRLEDFNIARKDLEDYLYEYQRILDSPGSQKSQLTKYGIIAVIPIVVFSAFPESMLPFGKFSLVAGVAIGVLLAVLLKGVSVLRVRAKLRRLRSDYTDFAAFADAAMRFQPNI